MSKIFESMMSAAKWVLGQTLGRYMLTFIAGMAAVLLVQCSVAKAGELVVNYDFRANGWSMDACSSGTCIGYDFANGMGCLSRNTLSGRLRLSGGMCYQHNTNSLVGRATGALSDDETTGELWSRVLLFEQHVEGAYGVGFRYVEQTDLPSLAGPMTEPVPREEHHHRERHRHED